MPNFSLTALSLDSFLKNQGDFRPTGTVLRYLRREKEIADYGTYSQHEQEEAESLRPLFFLLDEDVQRAQFWLINAAERIADGTVKVNPKASLMAQFLAVKLYYRKKYAAKSKGRKGRGNAE